MRQRNAVIFSRVSTETQDNMRQIYELKEFASKHNLEVQKTFKEVVSGAKKNDERIELSQMLDFAKKNGIDTVLIWELSRLGRNTKEVLNTISDLTESGISLYIKNYNLETLTNGKVNPLSQFMIQILSSLAEMERSQIRARMISGYNNFRKNGGKVGRKIGYKKVKEKLLEEHKDIVKHLRRGQSIRNTMKLTDKSSGTVQKIKRLIGQTSHSKIKCKKSDLSDLTQR